ncbi:hypothetical protein [Paenibacillus albus]|uniref:Uncharacterized protein n=1 Tax=Paenibacillus albus TaxID=2495582 RepID=A0A3S9ACG5_9BACL|nr:hypothetical protein [Paenibacillus albus]AZN43356.1 hypothetical protein EJC50_29445 [Paenibacillus albus]
MGLLNLPRIPRGASPEQMANIYNQAIEEMEHRVNGFLQSSNIQEVGGWKVGQTELESKDKDVGMSTVDTSGDDVRFWAGGSNPDTAPWRVTKSGKMTATGAKIESNPGGYPNIVLDPSDDSIVVYFAADKYVGMGAIFGVTPEVKLVNGTKAADITMSTNFQLLTNANIDIGTITPGGKVNILGDNVFVDSFSYLKPADVPGFPSLSSQLSQKAIAGANTSSAGGGTFNGGIPIGTVLATAGGGSVTWNGISIPSHSHNQN